jgi:hypothetical protein
VKTPYPPIVGLVLFKCYKPPVELLITTANLTASARVWPGASALEIASAVSLGASALEIASAVLLGASALEIASAVSLGASALEIASARLLALDGLEQRLEVSLAETERAVPFD